ncbi:unnamed protein product [Rotaria sp. Silwood1]|nr:unnamed protein product [Rotaria sp. Silwood1]CAF0859555.1 unnamed protein product [Rotaria sp. Silwood1]CAF3384949.1 unnamed protein product [Rotaria sp. Silwood1]CAF4567237.1 unnamed protein product [Rotaria sp. Silwood1]
MILQLKSYIVWSQRDFVNPAVTDPAPCSCDVRINVCDPNCCCDPDCKDFDLTVSPICKSRQTTASYASATLLNFQTWNCSNSTSAAAYDYFPFVCVQFELHEILGIYHPTRNMTFLKRYEDATNLYTTFVDEYSDLFQSTTLISSSSTVNYSIGAPIKQTSNTSFTLPGNLAGITCQENVNVLFGINRDFSCPSISVSNLCSRINSVTSFLKGGDSSSLVNVTFYTKTYSPSGSNIRDFTTEYYFQNSTSPNINDITSNNITIYDYCPGRHPTTRTQRYLSVCNVTNIDLCSNQYQTWSGCPSRDNLQYSTIEDRFFIAVNASIDDSTNFADFNNAINVTLISCPGNIMRVFYRFNYSSVDNTISTVEVFVLYAPSSGPSSNPRITIEWNNVANDSASSTTIPRGYLDGEVLQFRRNNFLSDVSTLVASSNGLCIDATRQNIRYKKGTSSYCFIQLRRATIQQCHDLKLNMYLYLNTFYAPASHVLAYPSANATLIQIRDENQDKRDLDRIDQTRLNNLLNTSYITRTRRNTSVYAIYDATETLSICYDVPSGIYIEFGYVRVQISPTVSFERIVSVQYNYTYSNWHFDCTKDTCDSTSTQRYPVSFQSAFFDFTSSALNLTSITKADITSADNYIQHLLWLITPEYHGEPSYRNYTIAMILIFIAISVVVMHVLLFGMMFPF